MSRCIYELVQAHAGRSKLPVVIGIIDILCKVDATEIETMHGEV